MRSELILVVLLVACSGNDDVRVHADAPLSVSYDAPPPDASGFQACLAIRAQWLAQVAIIGDACDVDGDCAAIGGVTTNPGCVGGIVQIAPAPGDCTGSPVNAAGAAAAHDELAALEAAFHACVGTVSCSGLPGISCLVDCPTGSKPVCAGHRCALEQVATCPPVIDGGVADAP